MVVTYAFGFDALVVVIFLTDYCFHIEQFFYCNGIAIVRCKRHIQKKRDRELLLLITSDIVKTDRVNSKLVMIMFQNNCLAKRYLTT